jgi:hypothetical protein
MIVALLILIVLILLFDASAVKSAIARILMFTAAVCIGSGPMGDAIGDDGPLSFWPSSLHRFWLAAACCSLAPAYRTAVFERG